jgi:predicted Rossmann-fold nucleotide-binding protein
VKKGLPMGLLTGDKQVYVLLEDHENPKPYAQLKEKVAETVTVEGNKVTGGGTQGFVVDAVK